MLAQQVISLHIEFKIPITFSSQYKSNRCYLSIILLFSYYVKMHSKYKLSLNNTCKTMSHVHTHVHTYMSIYFSPFHKFYLCTLKWSTLEVTSRVLTWNGVGMGIEEWQELNTYLPSTICT
uniref:Uncharacterized protein n=1 Tax=Myotis myotis TaxID=51298 RepID=A0A7J7Y066_MYOMY|nr:hypothetical protein mMyoMyo1_011404 [Myotis myotis]